MPDAYTRARLLLALSAPLLIAAASPRESLGVAGSWGAFRDIRPPRCFAIAEPAYSLGKPAWRPFAAVTSWPTVRQRGQLHIRLGKRARAGRPIELRIADKRFALVIAGAEAWAPDPASDTAIVTAMRTARWMTVRGTGEGGDPIRERYSLDGAATAIDAAALGCAATR